MPKYFIEVQGTYLVSSTIIVDADTKQEALDIVSLDIGNTDWKHDDLMDYEVVGVSEAK